MMKFVRPRSACLLLLVVILCLGIPDTIVRVEARESLLASISEKVSSASSTTTEEATIPAELKKLREMLREGEEAFSTEQARTFLPEVLPLVEKITGRKLKKIPELKLVGRKEITEALTKDLVPQMKKLLPQSLRDSVEKISRQEASSFAPLLLGKYGFSDKILYLLPRNVQPLFRVVQIDEKYIVPITKLLVAHELTHALQDQEIDLLQRLSNLKSQEDALCINAVIEGHAVLVMEAVAREMKLDESLIETSRLFAAGAVKFNDPGLRLLNNVISSRFESIYLGGRKFMEFHLKGNPENLWNILHHPPGQTSMILNPETYAADAAATPDYAKALEGLESDLGQPGFTVQNTEIGQMNLQSAYAAMDPTKRDQTLRGIIHVQALVAVSSDSMKMGNISLFVMKSPELAGNLLKNLSEMARNNLEELKKSEMVKLVSSKFSDFVECPGDASQKMVLVMKTPDKKTLTQSIYRVVSGSLMVEVMDSGQAIPEATIAAAIKRVLKGYEELILKKDPPKGK